MKHQSKDYYTVLGVSKLASQHEIKQAYKQLALIHHPDRNHDNSPSSVQRFRQICLAYEVLSDSEKRKNYDVYGLVQTYSNGSTNFNLQTAQNLFKKYFNNSKNHYEDDSTQSSHDTTKDSKFKSHPTFSTNYENPDFYDASYDPLTHLSEIGGEGISKSVTTSTMTLNGETTTIKRTTVQKKDGSKDITEETTDQLESQIECIALELGKGLIISLFRIDDFLLFKYFYTFITNCM